MILMRTGGLRMGLPYKKRPGPSGAGAITSPGGTPITAPGGTPIKPG